MSHNGRKEIIFAKETEEVSDMYQIALCDDEEAELNKTENMLKSYQEQNKECDFSIERFSSADDLLWRVKENAYMPDLLLMDIYMPRKLGIEAAKELRGMGNECRIIFLTTSKEYALEAFRVDAAQYLVKPVSEGELFPVLDKLLGSIREEQKKYLLLRIDSRNRRIAMRDIVYCEAQKKCQCIYLSDGTQLLLRLTMAKIFEMLSGYKEFAKAGISYIVNLEHVESLNAQELQMDNGRTVYLPRGSYQSLKEQYFAYYCGEDEDG